MLIVNSAFITTLFFERFSQNIKICADSKNSNNQLIVLATHIDTVWVQMFYHSAPSYTTTLMELTGIDLTKLHNYSSLFSAFGWTACLNDYARLVYYNLYNYNAAQRTIFAFFFRKKDTLLSVCAAFHNSVWLERELVEFFGVSVIGQTDTRNLLLDYNVVYNPLLKTFPTEGVQEIFFNYLTYNLDYAQIEFIEL